MIAVVVDGCPERAKEEEEELAECLKPQITENISPKICADRAGRRLRELGEKAAAQGGKHMGAVWILPILGGGKW